MIFSYCFRFVSFDSIQIEVPYQCLIPKGLPGKEIEVRFLCTYVCLACLDILLIAFAL